MVPDFLAKLGPNTDPKCATQRKEEDSRDQAAQDQTRDPDLGPLAQVQAHLAFQL